MAPEVILGLPYDYKADVFSYGIVLLEVRSKSFFFDYNYFFYRLLLDEK